MPSTTAALLAALATVVALILLRCAWRRRRLYQLAWQLPGPFSLPIVGAAHLLLRPEKVLTNIRHLAAQHGDLFALWLGPRLVVHVQRPADIERILTAAQCVDKGPSYRFVAAFLGDGLVTLQGDNWRRHRKLLNPAFARAVIDRFAGIKDRHVRRCVQRLLGPCEAGVEFDIMDAMQRMSMDLICETTMDRKMNMQGGENGDFLSAINAVHEVCGARVFNPLLHPEALFRRSGWHRQQQRSIRLLHAVVDDIVARKTGEKELEDRQPKPDNDEEKPIFIDRALRVQSTGGDGDQRRGLSAAEVRDETNTILVAGYETTATQLSYVLLMLAMHPDCQARVHEECQSVYLAPDSDALRPSDLAPLTYLDMCIKETMRLFPIVPFMMRKTSADVVIGDHTIPAGVELLISVMGVSRSPQHYRHPERFWPEHFLPDAVRERHGYAFLPFSAGPRSCIGQRYAMNVLRMALVHIVRSYRLHTSLRTAELRTIWKVTLCLQNGHMIRLERR